MRFTVFGVMGKVAKEYDSHAALMWIFGPAMKADWYVIHIRTDGKTFDIRCDVDEWYAIGEYDTLPELLATIKKSTTLRRAKIYVDDEPHNCNAYNTVQVIAEVTPATKTRLDALLKREGMTFGAWVKRMLDR